MKIAVIGGGPGGLYFSILTKKAIPHCEITVFERNKADDSFGFGVVFSDETLSEFLTRDPESYDLIRSKFAYWDELDVARDGEVVRITGNGFCGCSRKTLLQLLQARCKELGVKLHFESEVSDIQLKADYDLVVAADGIGSGIRTALSKEFGTNITLKRNKFVWMGSTKPLDAFTYFFRTTPFGVIVAHTYQYEAGMSTWIFECSPETWTKAGFETENEADTITKLQDLFKVELAGHGLIPNRSHWRQFPHVTNEKWTHENIVLLGDAKATAHFSIGSGTKLAMECAIGLSDAVVAHPHDLQKALEQYEGGRRKRVEMIQHAANVSLDWFENMDRHIRHPFYQFAFGVMTRAKKVTYENLQLRDRSFTDKVLTEFNQQRNLPLAQSAAFAPLKLRELDIPNRMVMSPMGQYSAVDGLVNDWHLTHYGSRAIGGVGLIIAEMTAINKNGRITLGCAGIYSEEQLAAWKRITEFVHQNSSSKIGIQLGHSGRKGSAKKPWEHEPLSAGDAWPLISASALPFSNKSATPLAIGIDELNGLEKDFIQATINADKAGFDLIELQAHHGFLLASFLSPLTNTRADEFGGSLENRLKFPLRVFTAMRANFPAHKPMSVRISASDWAEGGLTSSDAIEIAKAFKLAGADIINVSTGNTVSNQQPATGRMWQTTFADEIKSGADIPTITAGSIQDIDQINTLLLNGRADLIALGRPLLLDPNFVRRAEAYENHRGEIPNQYFPGVTHLFPLIQQDRKQVEQMKKSLKPESHKQQ